MKKTTLPLLASLVLGGLMVGGASTQAQVTNAPRPTLRTNAAGVRPTSDPTEYYARRLGLNEEQKQKAKPIFAEQRQKMEDLRKHPELKREERAAKFKAIREEANTKLKAILTPEQWEKYTNPFPARANAPARRVTNAVPAAPATPK